MGVMQQNRRNSILLGADNNALMWLIAINAVIFVLLGFVKIVYVLTDELGEPLFKTEVLNWFMLPAQANILFTRPWTIFTAMFTHADVWALIGNVLWLWAFGYILQDLTGNKKIIPIYIYGGVAGALFFVLTFNVFPTLRAHIGDVSPMVGAGSSIMAIAIATTVFAPNYRLLPMLNGGIPLWVLTLVYVAFDYATVASTDAGTAVAHLAAAGIGFLYVKQLQKGNDLGAWMINLTDWINDLCNPDKKYKKPSIKQQVFYKASKKPYEKISRFSQQRLDEILDKINEDGYSSLSNDEKDFLRKASKEDF